MAGDYERFAEEIRDLGVLKKGALVVSFAEALLPLYRRYDAGRRQQEMRTLIDAMWDGLAEARLPVLVVRSDQREATIGRLVPDVDQDRAPFAGLAQTSALAAICASDYLGTLNAKNLEYTCDAFDEAVEELADGAEPQAGAQPLAEFARSLQGLPPDQVLQRLAAYGGEPEEPCAPDPEVREDAGRFVRELLHLLAQDDVPLRELLRTARAQAKGFGKRLTREK